MSYHVDRFFAAVSVLAGHGHIKQRLIKADEDNLVDINEDELPASLRLDINEDELPASLRQPFADLKSRIYRVTPLNGEGPICASVRKMSVSEASECAASVVSLYGEMAGLKAGAGLALPLDDQKPAPVPPFLVKSN
jgi:hypothetical protein